MYWGRGALITFRAGTGPRKLLFRGPKRDLDQPFVAFLGGTNTYGKFIERPFPDLGRRHAWNRMREFRVSECRHRRDGA